MDYFHNGNDFSKGYALPNIGYYMNSASAGVLPLAMHQMGQDAQQGLFTAYATDPYAGMQAQQQQLVQVQPVTQAPKRKNAPKTPARRRTNAKQAGHPNAGYEHPHLKHQHKLDPFAPECSIPLPFQLGDEYSYYGPTAIWKRNERERHRVRCVNDGYEKLRNHLPVPDKDRRLSKVETLRFAIRYIKHMEKLLADSRHDEQCDCDFSLRSPSVPCTNASDTMSPPVTDFVSAFGNQDGSNVCYKRVARDDMSEDNED